jgi:aryl-alcohol dehydrogenase-like predicted oxidoreductase
VLATKAFCDLYQVHRPAPDTDVEETLSVLTDLLREGKVRAIGASTFPAADIVEAQWVAERRGLARFRSEQPPYSILNRSIEREVLPTCQRYGMGVMAWSPLAKGMLTGKHRTMEQLDGYLSGAGVVLSDEVLDRIDEIVPPGIDVAPLEGAAYVPPAISELALRRRPAEKRAAA